MEPIVKVERPNFIRQFGPCQTAPIDYAKIKRNIEKYKAMPIEPMVTRTGCRPKEVSVKPSDWKSEATPKVVKGNEANFPRVRAQTRASLKKAKSPEAEIVKIPEVEEVKITRKRIAKTLFPDYIEGFSYKDIFKVAKKNVKEPEAKVVKKRKLNTYYLGVEDGPSYGGDYKVDIKEPIILAAADNIKLEEADPHKEVFEQLAELLNFFSENPVFFDNNHPSKVTPTNNLQTTLPSNNTSVAQPSVSHVKQQETPLVVAAKITPSRKTTQNKRTKKEATNNDTTFMDRMNSHFYKYSSYVKH